jgi:hypothetical protein
MLHKVELEQKLKLIEPKCCDMNAWKLIEERLLSTPQEFNRIFTCVDDLIDVGQVCDINNFLLYLLTDKNQFIKIFPTLKSLLQLYANNQTRFKQEVILKEILTQDELIAHLFCDLDTYLDAIKAFPPIYTQMCEEAVLQNPQHFRRLITCFRDLTTLANTCPDSNLSERYVEMLLCQKTFEQLFLNLEDIIVSPDILHMQHVKQIIRYVLNDTDQCVRLIRTRSGITRLQHEFPDPELFSETQIKRTKAVLRNPENTKTLNCINRDYSTINFFFALPNQPTGISPLGFRGGIRQNRSFTP